MASTTFPGTSIPWMSPSLMGVSVAPSFGTMTIDATGEMAAFCGRVWFPARTGSKSIRRLGFRFGTVVKAGGSGLTVSLQDVSLTAGPPMQPDETQDQTVAIANANASFVSNTWIRTDQLSADRTVAFGELVAVVVEYDGSGRLSSDSVQLSGLASAGTLSGPYHHSASTVKASGTWAAQTFLPNIILEMSDGTFGTLFGAFPCSVVGTLTYNSGSATDEYALEMTFPGPVKVDAGGGIWNQAASADADVVVYDGETAMTDGTVTIDAQTVSSAGGNRWAFAQFPALLTLAANTTYRLALKPTTANSVALHYFDVSDAGHLVCHVGGTAWALTGRVNGGSWDAPTTTRRPFLWPFVGAFDDGASAGGGAGGYAAWWSR